MPIPKKYLSEFRENQKYHVYNRTNNKERLFLSDENHRYFHKKFNEYLSEYLETFGWCHLPNHFHFLIGIKSELAILNSLQTLPHSELSLIEKNFLEKKCSVNKLIVHGFKRFFQCYSQSFNKAHNRNGNLFYTPFKRVLLEQDSDFKRTLVYIHRNPVKHGLINDFTKYRWSSWNNYAQNDTTELLLKGVIDLFGGRDHFIKSHIELNLPDENEFSIED